MSKLESNEDLVHDLMNYSPAGGLCQVFIVQAIQHYAQGVVTGKIPAPGGGFIHPRSWELIAEDTIKRMDAFYNRHQQEQT